MKKLNEFVTIKNLTDDTTTVVDDEGNIEGLDSDDDLFSFAGDEDDSFSLRPDGSYDGLDDLEGHDLDFDLEFGGGVEGEGLELESPLENTPLEDALGTDDDLGDEFEEAPFGIEDAESEESEDPDFQGVIRTVTGACLVYKRKTEEGTFEELWIYNVGKNMRNEVKIRRAILAGTDIPVHGVTSDDGTQEMQSTTIGNVQYLRLTGLPN